MAAQPDTQMMDPRALPGAHIDLNDPAQPAHEILGLTADDLKAADFGVRLKAAATRLASDLDPKRFEKYPAGVQRVVNARYGLMREAVYSLQYPFKPFMESIPARVMETGVTVFAAAPEQLRDFAGVLDRYGLGSHREERQNAHFLVVNSGELHDMVRGTLPAELRQGLRLPGDNILTMLDTAERRAIDAIGRAAPRLMRSDKKTGLRFDADMPQLVSLKTALTRIGVESFIENIPGEPAPFLRPRTKYLQKMVMLLADAPIAQQLQYELDMDLLSDVSWSKASRIPGEPAILRYATDGINPAAKDTVLLAILRAGVAGAHYTTDDHGKEWLQIDALDPPSNRLKLDALGQALKEHRFRHRPQPVVDAASVQRDPDVIDVAAEVVRDR